MLQKVILFGDKTFQEAVNNKLKLGHKGRLQSSIISVLIKGRKLETDTHTEEMPCEDSFMIPQVVVFIKLV